MGRRGHADRDLRLFGVVRALVCKGVVTAANA